MGLRMRVLTSLEEIASLEREWEAMRASFRGSIFLSHPFMMAWLNNFADLYPPKVVVVEDGSGIRGALPLVQRDFMMMGMRCRALQMVGAAGYTQEYHELAAMSLADDVEARAGMLDAIAKLRWQLLDLSYLSNRPENLSFMSLVKERWGLVMRDPMPIPGLDFPADGGDLLSLVSTRMRRSLRSTLKELEKDGRIEVRLPSTTSEMERAAKDYIWIHKERWRDRGGSIFQDPRQANLLRDQSLISARNATGYFVEVIIDGELSAQLLCLLDGDVGRCYRLSINPKRLEHNPGHIIVMKAMEEFKRRGMRHVDMGTGSEEFKYRLGAKDTYTLGYRSMRGRLAWAQRALNIPGARKISEMTGLRERAQVSLNR